MQKLSKPRAEQLIEVFVRLGGTARTKQLLAAGVHPRDLYAARDSGLLREVSRGAFRLADRPITEPDILVVAARMPGGVLCLLTALHQHGLTQEIPRAIHVALPRGTHPARLSYPPLEVYHFSDESLSVGVQLTEIDEATVRLTDPAKTVADAFKFRGRIGLETALDALKQTLGQRKATLAEIDQMARVCRVQSVIRPYLEALS